MFVEVYDDKQPSSEPVEVLTVEALSPVDGVVLAEVRILNCVEDHVDLVQQRVAFAAG